MDLNGFNQGFNGWTFQYHGWVDWSEVLFWARVSMVGYKENNLISELTLTHQTIKLQLPLKASETFTSHQSYHFIFHHGVKSHIHNSTTFFFSYHHSSPRISSRPECTFFQMLMCCTIVTYYYLSTLHYQEKISSFLYTFYNYCYWTVHHEILIQHNWGVILPFLSSYTYSSGYKTPNTKQQNPIHFNPLFRDLFFSFSLI